MRCPLRYTSQCRVRRCVTCLDVEDRHETAEDHALAVEGHLLAHRPHARISPHLLVRRIPDLLRWVFEPAKYDDLILLRLHSPPEVRELAVRDIVAPAFHDTCRPELLEQRRCLGSMLAENLLVAGR